MFFGKCFQVDEIFSSNNWETDSSATSTNLKYFEGKVGLIACLSKLFWIIIRLSINSLDLWNL